MKRQIGVESGKNERNIQGHRWQWRGWKIKDENRNAVKKHVE